MATFTYEISDEAGAVVEYVTLTEPEIVGAEGVGIFQRARLMTPEEVAALDPKAAPASP